MPESFAQTGEGLLLIANGIDPVLRWDSYAGQADPAGLVAPTTAATGSGSGAGLLTGSYQVYVSFLRADGFESSLGPISGSFLLANSAQIDYTGIPVSPDPRVTGRRIYRNTNGQARTYYLDVELTNNTATTATGTLNDTLLSAQLAFAIFGQDVAGNNLLRTLNNNPPPDTKPFLCFHLNRCFLAGYTDYAEGSCEVVQGSATVQGRGTRWRSNWGTRLLYVDGADATAEILSVDETTQQITLTGPYQGVTDPFAGYAIRPTPGECSLVYFSDLDSPEAWPPFNAIAIAEDDDPVTGLMPMYGFVYINKRRSIYKFTSQADPAADGFLFLASRRGCINHRCAVVVDENAYLLDERGIHLFTGSQESQSISDPIQDLFRPGSDTPINWNVSRFFHAAHSPGQSTIRWFVAFNGDYLPRHALCYCYSLQRWWVEQYHRPIGCSVLGQGGSSSHGWGTSGEQLYLGSDANEIFGHQVGAPDVVLAPKSLKGVVLSAGLETVTVRAALVENLVGAPVVHRAVDRGVLQTRRIVAVSGSVLTVAPPWLYTPEQDDEIILGGFPYQVATHAFKFVASETYAERSMEVFFGRNPGSAIDIEVSYDDFGSFAASANVAASANYGIEVRSGRTTSRLDMAKKEAFGIVHFDGAREGNTDGRRDVQINLTGIGGNGLERIYEMTIKGATV